MINIKNIFHQCNNGGDTASNIYGDNSYTFNS